MCSTPHPLKSSWQTGAVKFSGKFCGNPPTLPAQAPLQGSGDLVNRANGHPIPGSTMAQGGVISDVEARPFHSASPGVCGVGVGGSW